MPKVLSLAEPHTLENLVTHQIKKWLLCDYQMNMWVCASVHLARISAVSSSHKGLGAFAKGGDS